MANFDIAYDITAKHEGGYTWHPRDKGGETYKGIARNFNQDTISKPIFDWLDAETKRRGRRIPKGTVFSQLEPLVKNWYRATKWKQAQGDAIQNQELANFVFDFVVNSGQARRVINETINATAGRRVTTTTNALTQESINYLNSNSAVVYPRIVEARKRYVKQLDTFPVFGTGWFNRIDSFPTALGEKKNFNQRLNGIFYSTKQHLGFFLFGQ